jgi:hypothetical protein
MCVLAQTLLHQQDVMQGGDDREEKRGSQKLGTRDPNSAHRTDLIEQHEEDGRDL